MSIEEGVLMYDAAQAVTVELEGEFRVTLTTSAGVLKLDCFEALELATKIQERRAGLAGRFREDIGEHPIAVA